MEPNVIDGVDILVNESQIFIEEKSEEKFEKGWNHGERSQGRQGKYFFPRTTHDTCHSCVGL